MYPRCRPPRTPRAHPSPRAAQSLTAPPESYSPDPTSSRSSTPKPPRLVSTRPKRLYLRLRPRVQTPIRSRSRNPRSPFSTRVHPSLAFPPLLLLLPSSYSSSRFSFQRLVQPRSRRLVSSQTSHTRASPRAPPLSRTLSHSSSSSTSSYSSSSQTNRGTAV